MHKVSSMTCILKIHSRALAVSAGQTACGASLNLQRLTSDPSVLRKIRDAHSIAVDNALSLCW